MFCFSAVNIRPTNLLSCTLLLWLLLMSDALFFCRFSLKRAARLLLRESSLTNALSWLMINALLLRRFSLMTVLFYCKVADDLPRNACRRKRSWGESTGAIAHSNHDSMVPILSLLCCFSAPYMSLTLCLCLSETASSSFVVFTCLCLILLVCSSLWSLLVDFWCTGLHHLNSTRSSPA